MKNSMNVEGLRISVIIPVYNDFESLNGLLPLLEIQTLDKSMYEVIVVDNCSDSDLNLQIKDYNWLSVLSECNHKGSPYSCRNRGIEQAKGSIIALLDSTCYPDETWLEEALACFKDPNVDMVAGNVGFRFAKQIPTAGEFYDSITNIKMKESVTERNVAKTANLFVQKRVFDEVGMFEEGIRSGGDVAWTKKATDAGYTLSFGSKVLVKKEARKFYQLLKKQFRVGKGQPKIWKSNGVNKPTIKVALSILKPISFPRFIKNHKSISKEAQVSVLRLFVVASLVRITMRFANTLALISK